MRLSSPEIKVLLDTINQIDADAQVRLFGSRTDNQKKGGDIDLLILSQKTEAFTRQALRQIRQIFFDAFGEQKLDIIVDTLPPKTPFVKTIMSTSLPINNAVLEQSIWMNYLKPIWRLYKNNSIGFCTLTTWVKRSPLSPPYEIEDFDKLENLSSRYARSIVFLVRKVFRSIDEAGFESRLIYLGLELVDWLNWGSEYHLI